MKTPFGTNNSQCFICKKSSQESKKFPYNYPRCKIYNHFDKDSQHREKEEYNDRKKVLTISHNMRNNIYIVAMTIVQSKIRMSLMIWKLTMVSK